MSQRLLSDMSPEQLEAERLHCQQKGQEALSAGLISEYRVWEQRYYLARSYQMNTAEIVIGATYGLSDNTGLFIAQRLHGVFAYGHLLGETQERGYPIGQLVALDFPSDHSPA